MAKKSLAEQIAELSLSKTDFDIENETADPFAQNSGEELESSDEELQREHYVPVSKSKLRKEKSLVKDKKYEGLVISRGDLYDQSDASGAENASEANESEEESDAENPEDANASDSGASLRANSDEESSGSENEDAGSGEDVSEEENEEEADVKRAKIKAMMAKERKHIVNRLSESVTADALKGYSVLQQHKEFDALIDLRLKVQLALVNSNMLPPNKQALAAEELATEHTDKYINKATEKCFDLLDAIFSLRCKLYSQEHITAEPVHVLPKKRTLEEYVGATEKLDTILNQFRGPVLTKWLAKIQNASGSSALNASKFKALNQSAEQQVLNNLADQDRLVKRTRLNRRKITPLGYDYYKAHFSKEHNDDKEEQDDDADVPAAKTQARSLNIQELDVIFDDEDFYRVLLNDLVDKKIQSSDPTLGLQFALKGAASTKLKKNVDNKASKGRKLRYHVQEQIANFDTPRNVLTWDDGQIDEFFASLLGQKISMKEDESASEDEDDGVADDAIQLFG